MVHPHNPGAALKNFLKFCTTKGANRYMGIIKLLCILINSRSAVGILKQFYTMKEAKEAMEIILIIFPDVSLYS